MLAETISIQLKDPKLPPKLATKKPPVMFLNGPWSFQPETVTTDASTAKLTWKLGEQSPAGLTINPKTGELKWNPGDDIPPGEITIPLIVTDNDSPPLSTNLSLVVEAQDDEASFTRLDAIFIVGGTKRAFFYDPSKNKKTELHEGDEFTVADITGTVKQIRRKSVILTVGTREIRLDAGQSLREAQMAVAKTEEEGITR